MVNFTGNKVDSRLDELKGQLAEYQKIKQFLSVNMDAADVDFLRCWEQKEKMLYDEIRRLEKKSIPRPAFKEKGLPDDLVV